MAGLTVSNNQTNTYLNKQHPQNVANSSHIEIFQNALNDQENTQKTHVTVSTSQELKNQLDTLAQRENISDEITISLKPGIYRMDDIHPGNDRGINITGLNNIKIKAEDPTTPPLIERLTLKDSNNIKFDHIDFGIRGDANDWKHQDRNQTALKFNGGSNINISNSKISGMYDGVSANKVDTFTLQSSHFSNIRRDGLIVNHPSGSNNVNNNVFESFRPNYENISRDQFTRDKTGTVYVNGEAADHADAAQFTFGKSDASLTIKNNRINASEGGFVQGIFIHNENAQGIKDILHNEPIKITDNTLQNNHEIGIKVCNQSNLTSSNNTFIPVSKDHPNGQVDPQQIEQCNSY